jgi:hypothetical protein
VKGAILVSPDAELLTKAVDLLARDHPVAATEDWLQVTDSRGRRYTLHGNAVPDWEWREHVDTTRCPLPTGWPSMHGFAVECRWEDLFVILTTDIASSVSDALWIIDGDGMLWHATEIDIDELRL